MRTVGGMSCMNIDGYFDTTTNLFSVFRQKQNEVRCLHNISFYSHCFSDDMLY